MRIVVVGNSVGLRVRPPRDNRADGNFSEILEQLLRTEGHTDIFIYNRCKSALTVAGLYEEEFDFIVGFSPDAIIMICGINEAVSRPLPRNVYQLLNKPRPFCSSFGRFFLRINSGFNKIVFPRIIKGFGLKGWETSETFISHLRVFADLVYKETRSHCFVMNILPCSNRIESLLPDSQARITSFNEKLEEFCTNNSHVHLVDVAKLVPPDRVSRLMPDGIHMCSELHLEVAHILRRMICSNISL